MLNHRINELLEPNLAIFELRRVFLEVPYSAVLGRYVHDDASRMLDLKNL